MNKQLQNWWEKATESKKTKHTNGAVVILFFPLLSLAELGRELFNEPSSD